MINSTPHLVWCLISVSCERERDKCNPETPVCVVRSDLTRHDDVNIVNMSELYLNGVTVNSTANARRIADVEQCFGSAGQPLAVPGRVLVGEGVLTKACRKKPKPRQFFLFNDILVYGNIIINKKKYTTQHIIPLEDVKLQSLEDDGQFKNGWLICTRGKSFAVYAATATEKQEWMAHINKCIEELIRKSGKKPADSHAAVWVPDSEANTCMHCKKVQFSFVNRRHHCRKCGIVACNDCTNKRFLLPEQSSKPLRVCLTCFEELAMQSAGINNSSKGDCKTTDSSGEEDSDEEENGPSVDNKRSSFYDESRGKI